MFPQGISARLAIALARISRAAQKTAESDIFSGCYTIKKTPAAVFKMAPEKLTFSPLARRKIEADFPGGRITSDARLLLLL